MVGDFYDIGVFGMVLQLLKLFDGMVKVMVEGLKCIKIMVYMLMDEYFEVYVVDMFDVEVSVDMVVLLMKVMVIQFDGYVKLNKKILLEIVFVVVNIIDLVKLVDMVVLYLMLKIFDC